MNKEYRGAVVKGNQEGRKFGFPTANIEVDHGLDPGVYSGYVDLENQSYRAAILVNPTKSPNTIEAHLLGFSDDLYGKIIMIRVEKIIRPWMEFRSLEEGKKQIIRDIKFITKQS